MGSEGRGFNRVDDASDSGVAVDFAAWDVIMYKTRPRRGVSDRTKIELGEGLGLSLSGRETQIVKLILAGHTTRSSIAPPLSISERTVHHHLFHIYAKTGAINMTDLVLMAMGRKSCAVDMSRYNFDA